MKYGHVDKKTGISLDRFHLAILEPDETVFNYTVELNGDTILENYDPQELAADIMKINERLYKIADFLRRKNAPRGTANEPSGDK